MIIMKLTLQDGTVIDMVPTVEVRRLAKVAFEMADALGAMTKPHELVTYGVCEDEHEARSMVELINDARDV